MLQPFEAFLFIYFNEKIIQEFVRSFFITTTLENTWTQKEPTNCDIIYGCP